MLYLAPRFQLKSKNVVASPPSGHRSLRTCAGVAALLLYLLYKAFSVSFKELLHFFLFVKKNPMLFFQFKVLEVLYYNASKTLNTSYKGYRMCFVVMFV